MPRRPPETDMVDLDDDVLPPAAAEAGPDTPAPGLHAFTVDSGEVGDRLDRRIAASLPGLSRSRAKALIEAGYVARVAPDSARATMADASHKVKAAEIYEVTVPEAVA